MPFTPCLGVRDTAVSKAFYEQLGFTVDSQTATEDTDIHMVLFDGQFCGMLYRHTQLENWLPSLQGKQIGFTGMFYLEVRDFQSMLDTCAAVTDIIRGPSADHTGTREFYIADPDGYILGFNDATSRQDSELVGRYASES
ncbi:VOC family protein [Nocardia uniformis]|uniref:VOC family protein n=1 Tax=Nocardia uniformis TaxID=53432 RepID=A0A849CBN0_9NOCA|nr:VOC family protein [Nocardia uniformis]NNH75256.1 VOC family protein [Nocardia uniformis]